MQTDLDKTMDAILRRARETGFTESSAAGAHLDADELSLFAENLSPTTARVRQVEHLANCGLCRNELAQLMTLNAEAADGVEPVSEAAAAPADILPWYRRLLLFPNLAYVMGSLVLVFGGLLAVSVYQSRQAEISYSTAAAAPERPLDAAANVASNSHEVSEGGGGVLQERDENADAVPQTGNTTIRTSSDANRSPRERNVVADSKNEDFTLSGGEITTAPSISQPEPRAYSEEEPREKMAADGAAGGPPRPADDPVARADTRKKAAPAAPRAQVLPPPKSEAFVEKVVSGKRFIRRDNVWYDVRYTGGPMIGVRRKTPEYQRLDASVKRIAEQLSGTAVIVADGGKAYRISD